MKTVLTSDFEKEWTTFYNNIREVGLDRFYDIETLKAQLKIASCALSDDTGCAYPGALIVHINLITALATRIAKMISGTFNINTISLLRVCLLMHLSKIEMFEPNDNQWEIDKRGLNYKFAETEGKLKFGERSILNAMNRGITLSAEEFEAIRCLDKENEEKGGKYFECVLATVVRQANELAYAIEKEKYKRI